MNGKFVAAMEDVLEVYARPPDPARPLVCFDEAGKALQGTVRATWPMKPDRPATVDSEYQRQGSANLFLFLAPHLGYRQIMVTEQRTGVDFAYAFRDMVDQFPDAERIVVVMDNLNTHHPGSLYHTFPPAEAYRIWSRCEVHYTPKHGSWMNMAELEFSVLHRQCLDRRIADRTVLAGEVAAWVAVRNQAATPVKWSFTIDDARTTLQRSYPEPVDDTIDWSDYSG